MEPVPSAGRQPSIPSRFNALAALALAAAIVFYGLAQRFELVHVEAHLTGFRSDRLTGAVWLVSSMSSPNAESNLYIVRIPEPGGAPRIRSRHVLDQRF